MKRHGRDAIRMLTALALTMAGAAAVPSPAAATTPLAGPIRQLSDQHLTTVVALASYRAAVHQAANGASPTITALHLDTEDGLPETYVVLATQKFGSHYWDQVAIPMKPNGTTGWVPRRALHGIRTIHTELVVNTQLKRITLYRRGREVFRAPVGIGKPSTPTPLGHFWIRDHFRIAGNPFYGPYAMGTSDYSNTLTDWPGGGVVGIHGTDQPELIPGAPSHGCIRMRDADLSRLFWMVPLGTPVWIK